MTATKEVTFPYIAGGFVSEGQRAGGVRAAADTARSATVRWAGLRTSAPSGSRLSFGAYLGRPSIGCAKSRLIGAYEEPGLESGAWSPLMADGEEIGRVVRTKARTRPFFVSVGYRITLSLAVEVVLRCARGYRLPEPTRIADRLAKQLP